MVRMQSPCLVSALVAPALVVGGSLCWTATAAEKGVADKSVVQIERWISDLDADSYELREAASRRLEEAGEAAQALLERAAAHPSPEVRFRAAAILTSRRRLPLRKLEFELVAFASGTEESLRVERGMCLISRLLDPQVKDQELTRKLDEIAQSVRRKLGTVDPVRVHPQVAIESLLQVLYVDYGFRGNEEDYNQPENCSLASVLATGKGKPVLLGQLIISVARRLKIPIVDVPVSGHYLVKYDGSQAPAGFPRDDIFVAPFTGKILSRADRARDYAGYDPDQMAPPASNRTTIIRILNNILGDLDEQDDAIAPHRRELAERMLQVLQQGASPP